MNNVQIIGRLTKDPDVRIVKGDKVLCEMRVAFPKNRNGERGFIDVVVWGATAEACGGHLKRGAEIGISGRLDPQEFTNGSGETRRVTKIAGEQIDFLRKPKMTRHAGDRAHETADAAEAADHEPIAF